MAYVKQQYFQQIWRRDVYIMTRKFLVLLFCILTLRDCIVVILKIYTVPMFLDIIRNTVNQKTFSSKHMSIFFTMKIWRHFSIKSQLR